MPTMIFFERWLSGNPRLGDRVRIFYELRIIVFEIEKTNLGFWMKSGSDVRFIRFKRIPNAWFGFKTAWSRIRVLGMETVFLSGCKNNAVVKANTLNHRSLVQRWILNEHKILYGEWIKRNICYLGMFKWKLNKF